MEEAGSENLLDPGADASPAHNPSEVRGRLRVRFPLAIRGRWWLTVLVLFGVSSAWCLATPIMGAADEPSHTIKAAAVARGQFFGTPEPNTKYGRSAFIRVKVPLAFDRAIEVPQCFAFRRNVTPSCAPPIGSSSRLVTSVTSVGRYLPLYYLVVGVPSLFWTSVTGIYVMRLLSALICCVFLASAWESAADSRRRAIAVPALVCAVPPMVFFMSGTIQPNGVEVAAAVCLWMSGLVLVTEKGAAHDWRLISRAGLSAAVLVQIRGLSLLWCALIALTLLAVARRDNLVQLFRNRAARVWAGVTAASGGFALWWILHYHTLAVQPSPQVHASLTRLLATTFGQVGSFVQQMIGEEGWLDVPLPTLTFYVWGSLIALAIGAGLVFGRRRRAVVLAVLTVAVVLVPMALEAKEAARLGLGWQGRYTLPLAAGVPMVAAFAVRAPGGRFPHRRLAAAVAAAAVVAQAAVFWLALRRYTVGLSGPLNPFGGKWSPPGGSLGVALLFVSAMAAYAALIVVIAGALGREEAGTPILAGEEIADSADNPA